MAQKENYPTVRSLQKQINELFERVDTLEKRLEPAPRSSLHKIETHTGETNPAPREKTNIHMDESFRVQSVKNASKILPPNRMVDGRHTKEDLSAICGFKVTDEIVEQVYGDAS
mgnify:CR=1 FL=1